MCSICKRDGHLKDECPEDFKKIELKPLPPMSDRFRDILDGLCRLCYCKPAALRLPISSFLHRFAEKASVVGLCCFCLCIHCSPDLCCVSAVELSPTHPEQQKREQILAGLERFIRKEYNGESAPTKAAWAG